jgi:hypothetical protein
VVLVAILVAANSSRNGGYRSMELSNFGGTPASNCGCPGDLWMGKTGEEELYNMGK